MAHGHLPLEDDVVKEVMLGKREETGTRLLEQVVNSVVQAQATEQLKARAIRTQRRADDGAEWRSVLWSLMERVRQLGMSCSSA